jgi:hypothetical protein
MAVLTEVEVDDSRDVHPAEMGNVCNRVVIAGQIRTARQLDPAP